jgi:hypothetical protein
MMNKLILSIAALTLAVTHGNFAVAATTYCITAPNGVGDVAALESTVFAAASKPDDSIIHLEEGRYTLPSGTSLTYANNGLQNLTIEGGYFNVFGPCGSAPTSPDPTLTIIDGGGATKILSTKMRYGSLKLSNITIANGKSASCPIDLGSGAIEEWSGALDIENVIFKNNHSTSADTICLGPTFGGTLISNSLFASNSTASTSPSAAVVYIHNDNSQAQPAIKQIIMSSTFSDNVVSQGVAVYSETYSEGIALIANNIFWGNHSSADAAFGVYINLVNNDIGSYVGTSAGKPTTVTNCYSIDPRFKNPSSDFSLRDDSPVRDMGRNDWPFLSAGTYDITGLPRTYSTPNYAGMNDLGAYEIQDVIFASSQEVSAISQCAP